MSTKSAKVSPNAVNIPFVAQIDSSDCGAACLSMVSQYFKKDLMLSEARSLCGNDVSGQRLSSAARKAGVDAEFIKKSFASAMSVTMPFIAHWEGNHWVVIAGQKDGKVKIADPASGIYWLKESEAEKAYSDYCITVSDDEKGSSDYRQREHVLLKCLAPFKRALIASSFLMLIMIGVEMFIPYSFQQIIDEELVSREKSFQWLMTYAGMAAVIVIIGYALLSYTLYRGAQKSESLVLDSILSKWINLPESFYRGRSFSELRMRLESAFQIKNFLVSAAGSGLFSLLEVIAVFAMLEYYGFALKFAILLLPTFILTFYTLYLSRENAGLFKFSRDTFLSKVDDITQGVFSIRASDAGGQFQSLQEKFKEEMYERVSPVERKLVVCEKGAQALGIAAWILLFFQICHSYVDSKVSTGVMFAVIILAALALNALSRIIGQREKFENAAMIYDYLNDVLDTKNEISERKVLSEPASLKFIDDHGSEFELEKSRHCIIAGSSAQAIVDKIESKEDGPFSVEMSVGDEKFESIVDYPQVSTIEENAHIFNMSLAENVALSEEVDFDRVKWCLRLSMADNIVDRLSQGISTKISRDSLSTDEEMKLLLARCLYRKRPLYVLKDISSFMNSKELLVFTYHMKVHLKNNTIIFMDRSPVIAGKCEFGLLVIGNSIVESGPVDKLLTMEKSFHKLYNY